MARPIHARLWLALACGAGAGLVWWLAGGEGWLTRVAAQAPETAARTARAEAELRVAGADAELDRPAVPEAGPAPVAEREPARTPPDEPVRPRQVVVRVQLALASGAQRSFAGWRVEAQSWIEATNETFPHETTADATGSAEFQFPGFVHVDWLRCTPPPESGLALAFSEHHEDLDPGESLSARLEFEPGGLLAARVLDLGGVPVTGARVHAYSENWSWDLSSWQPGLTLATSGADGWAELPPLPPGTWSLGVEPAGWLQLDPEPGDSRGNVEAVVGERRTGPGLLVAPLHHARLRLLDASDRPVAAAVVVLEPLEFRVPGLAAAPRESPEPLDVFLGRAEASGPPEEAHPWPHGELSWVTDARGEAELFGVPGRWSLTVTPELGLHRGGPAALRTELDLPGPDLTLRVPGVLAELRTRAVDGEGHALEGVRIELTRGDDDWSSSTRSAADGAITLRGLPTGCEYWLELAHPDRLPVRSSVWVAADIELPPQELRRTAVLRVQLVDPGGAPLAQKSLSILECLPSEPLRPAEAAWAAKNRRGARPTNKTGRVEFRTLPPGRVVLGLHLPVATPSRDGSRQVTYTTEVFQRWVLSIGADEERVVADLAGYTPPTAPPQALHSGVVVEARTGAPLAGAWVCLRAGQGLSHSQTNAEGRFSVAGAPGAQAFTILRPGYFSGELPERDWAAGRHEHRFELVPGSPELEIEFVDRDGARLPCVDVRVTDAGGGRVLACARARGGPFLANGQSIATDGGLVLGAFAAQRLRFELSIAGHALGAGEVDVGRAGPQASVRLASSLAEMRRAIEGETDEDGEDD